MEPAWQLELGRRWSEPHRHHHDLEHLRDVLDALDELASDGVQFDLPLVRRAAWFHDAVYDVHRADNEERSASLAMRMLPASMRDDVAHLVMTTKDHIAPPGDLNAAALCDADLSVLGASEERYAEYAHAIRQEYEHLSKEDYRRERAKVLAGLLERDPLFATDAGRARWEHCARRNVTAEIQRLRPVSSL